MEVEEVSVSGTVQRVIYRSPENSWSVLLLDTTDKKVAPSGEVVVTGVTEATQSQDVNVTGKWVERKGQKQIEASRIDTVLPTSPAGIEAYLASGIIKGIGAKKAKQIVAAFGKETLNVLDFEPGRLAEVKGFSKRAAEKVAAAWTEQAAVRRILLFLHDNNIPPGLCKRIYRAWGENAIDKIRANPYALATEVRGIGFRTADDIALRMGVDPRSPHRMGAALVHMAGERASQGHTGTPRGELVSKTAEMLSASDGGFVALVDQALDAAVARERPFFIIDENDVAWLAALYYCEDRIARFALDRAGRPAAWSRIDKAAIAAEAKRVGMDLAEQQMEAVLMAVKSRFCIITGGPGVGKTATTNVLIRVLKASRLEVLLAAPTGKAAQRASEATGHPASTIHRMLKMRGKEEGEDDNGAADKEAETLDADVVILDESSMGDVPLVSKTMAAIGPKTSLVLIGDVDQLPSVGPGRVLADLIDSGKVPCVRMNKVFRQAANSLIIRNAHSINAGHLPQTGRASEDFFILDDTRNPELGSEVASEVARAAARMVVDLVSSRLPRRYGFDPVRDIQVLTPMNKGDAGVVALNVALQTALNPEPAASVMVMGQRLGVGDKVIQTRNNYDLEVFNGDMGIVSEILEDGASMQVSLLDGRTITYDESAMDDLRLAYAMTIHKSQGSQAEAIVMPLVTQHWMMLQRNLLYTGVTRAKKLAVIVGQTRAVATAVRTNDAVRRLTALPGLLRQ